MEQTETLSEKKSETFTEETLAQAYLCLECGKCTGTCPMVELFPDHFNPRRILTSLISDPESVLNQPGIWMCASCYKCNKRCPQAIELPGIFLDIRKKALEKNGKRNLEKALKVIGEEIPFPASFISVCLHPERLQIELSTFIDLIDKTFKPPKSGKSKVLKEKVAVIGSGPAGLMTGNELKKKGYQVTIFESKSFAGGMLSECIPEYRMPLEIISSEIENMKSQGLDIKTDTHIGKDLSFKQLFKQGYEAIFIAVGAHSCQKLSVEGEDLDGVYTSLSFLMELKIWKNPLTTGKVVVIGGGNTAMDIASTAIKHGSGEVTILYRRSKAEIPADANEIRETEMDGARIQYLTAPLKFIGNKGRVNQIECIKMELGPPDRTGRKRPLPVKDSNFTIDADQVIVAIGEIPDTGFLPDQIEITRNGRIVIDPITVKTNMEGVYAGGDGVLGPATIAEAIVAGKKAANEIDKYLRSK